MKSIGILFVTVTVIGLSGCKSEDGREETQASSALVVQYHALQPSVMTPDLVIPISIRVSEAWDADTDARGPSFHLPGSAAGVNVWAQNCRAETEECLQETSTRLASEAAELGQIDDDRRWVQDNRTENSLDGTLFVLDREGQSVVMCSVGTAGTTNDRFGELRAACESLVVRPEPPG